MAPLAGVLDRSYGPRRVLLASAAALPFAVGALSAVDGKIWHYYMIMALIAVIGAGTLPGTYTAISLEWSIAAADWVVGFPIAVWFSRLLLPPAIQLSIPVIRLARGPGCRAASPCGSS